MSVGTAMFYYLSSYISEDTKYYPPTRQFFSSCIEVLGQVGSWEDLSNDGWSVKSSASGRFGCDFKCVAFRNVFISDILNTYFDMIYSDNIWYHQGSVDVT